MKPPRLVSGASLRHLATFAGPKSKTADHEALARAKEMAGGGASNEEVRQATGWMRDRAGHWTYEIDDSKARVRSGAKPKGTLSEYLKNDPLYEAYPELKDLQLHLADEATDSRLSGPTGGYFTLKRGRPHISIDAGEPAGKGAYTRRGVALHEAQHAIDMMEGRILDKDTASTDYRRRPTEVRAFETADRVNLDAKERKQIPPWRTMAEGVPSIDKGKMTFDELAFFLMADELKSQPEWLNKADDKRKR